MPTATERLVAQYILLNGEKAQAVVSAYKELGVETNINFRVENPKSGAVMLYIRGTEEAIDKVANIDGVLFMSDRLI